MIFPNSLFFMISYFPSAFGTDFCPKTHPDHTFGSKRPPKVAKREPKGTPGGSWKLSWGSFWEPWDLLGALWALTRQKNMQFCLPKLYSYQFSSKNKFLAHEKTVKTIEKQWFFNDFSKLTFFHDFLFSIRFWDRFLPQNASRSHIWLQKAPQSGQKGA